MSTTYRAAIIGCGDIGHAHADGYRLTPGVELVAVADPLEVARRQYVEEYGVPAAFASAADMLAEVRPDIVSVCVWHRLHAEMTVAAAEAGATAVICEKPMALGLREVDTMIDACEAHGTRLVVAHQRRFTPGYEAARRLVRSGVIGDVRLMHGRAGAGLLNVGTHLVDTMRFVAGDPPTRWVLGQVERRTDRFEREVPIEDRCVLLAELEGGAQLLVQSDLGRRQPGPPGMLVRIEGADGMVEATEGYARVLDRSGGWRQEVAVDPVDSIGGRANAGLVAELLAWLQGGPEHRCSARLGRQTTELLMAVYESARRHQVVHLPLEEDGYPLEGMVADGHLLPEKEGPYDIRDFLRRDGIDEQRYAALRASGAYKRHHDIMRDLAAERGDL